MSLPDNLTEIVYVANCTNFRRSLLNRYETADLDINEEIAKNADTKLTYLGYKRFLESDLQHIFPRGERRSAHSYKRDCKYLAKQMLTRGYVCTIIVIIIPPWESLDTDFGGIGLCQSRQSRLSTSPAALNPRVHQWRQDTYQSAEYQNRLYYPMALFRGSTYRWRVGQRSDGRVQSGQSVGIGSCRWSSQSLPGENFRLGS